MRDKKIMERKVRYYEIELGTSESKEKMYIRVNEDKTISAVKEKRNSSQITLREVCKELTNREYVETTNGFESINTASSQGLESRIENMKE